MARARCNLRSHNQLGFLAGIAGLAFLLIASSAASADPDWPAWRGPDRDGISEESDWTHDWPASGPKVLWKKKIGVGFSSCSVADGRVYTMGNVNETDIVYCLDAETGKEIWTHKYPCRIGKYQGPRMTPTVDGDLVYTMSREGDLFCLGTKDGKVKWSRKVREDFGVQKEPHGWGIACSPLVREDQLILDLGKVIVLDKKTGELAWSVGSDQPGFSSPYTFELGGRTMVTSFNAFGLVVVDMKAKKEVARYEWDTQYSVNSATPIVSGNRIFISSGYGKGCALLELKDGSLQEVYKNKEMKNHVNNSVLFKGHLYGFDGQQGSTRQLACLEFDNCEEKWRSGRLKVGALMIAGDRIVAMLDDGELLIAEASPDGFNELARAKVLSGRCWTYPVLCNGRIYCRSNEDGELVCVDVRK